MVKKDSYKFPGFVLQFMFEVDVVETCGGMLSLALEESFKNGDIAVIGPTAEKMKFLDWKPERFVDPLTFDAKGKYDLIVCIHCLPLLHGVKLINLDNKLYAAKGHNLIDLSPQQLKQAKKFIKEAKVRLPRGKSETLPLELHNMLESLEKALKPGGQAVIIDYGQQDMFDSLTNMENKYRSFSRFLASTSVGKLHVINGSPYLANSPHPVRDKVVLDVMGRLNLKNKLVPWLDLEKTLSKNDKAVLEPFITRMATAFSGWSEIVMEYRSAALEIKKLLRDSEGVSQLYSTLFVLDDGFKLDFVEKGWSRSNEIAGLPRSPPLFVVELHKV